MDFETGILVSFFIFIFNTLSELLRFVSYENYNHQNIGLRYSFWKGQYVEVDSGYLRRGPAKHLLIYMLNIIFRAAFVFLSWVYVGYNFFLFIHNFKDDILLAPESKKRYLNRVRRFNLSENQMIRETILATHSDSEEDFNNLKNRVRELKELKETKAA